MSIFVPNNSGTVRFTAGSTAIVGVGTTFTNYRAGSVISIPGLGEMQLAADPVSDTAAVGIAVWKGATIAAPGWAFQYLPRNEQATFSQKLTELLNQLDNGIVQALTGLNGADGNKGVMFTDAGVMSTFALTAFARTLLDDVSAAALYATLGGVPDANMPARLGVTSKAIPSNNYNLAFENGFYTGSGVSAVNGPPGNAAYGGLIVFSAGPTSNYIQQIAMFGAGGLATIAYMRGSNNQGGSYSPWTALHVEYGTNANGSYVRLPDGTQICWHRGASLLTASTAQGALFFSAAAPFTFPAAFTAAPVCIPIADKASGGSGLVWASLGNSFPTATATSMFIMTAVTGGQAYAAYAAIGRWY